MADVTEETAGGVEGAASKAVHDVRGNEELHELDGHEEHPGGGRFNRLLVFVVAGIAMIVGVVVVQGIRSAGVTTPSSATQAMDSGADTARNKAEVDDLAAGAVRPKSPAVVIPPAAPTPNVQPKRISLVKEGRASSRRTPLISLSCETQRKSDGGTGRCRGRVALFAGQRPAWKCVIRANRSAAGVDW